MVMITMTMTMIMMMNWNVLWKAFRAGPRSRHNDNDNDDELERSSEGFSNRTSIKALIWHSNVFRKPQTGIGAPPKRI